MLQKYAICLLLILAGCAAPEGPTPVGMAVVEERDLGDFARDQALRIRINLEFSNKLSDFTGIELTVYKGRVLLTGVAANEAVKADAVRITQSVPGVKDVTNGMNIHGEDGLAEYTRDGWMTTKLKALLYSEYDVSAPNYLIRTFDKVIYIFGVAQTKEEMQKVIEHAYAVTGVRKVVNLIEVAGTAQKPYK